jgi:thiamine biosynthesis lipoprotein
VTLFAPDSRTAQAAIASAFERLSDIDRTLNPDRADSEVTALNAAAGGPAVKVSDDLFAVLQHAQRLANIQRGAFDVTMGPYVEVWRRAAVGERAPSQAELEDARLRVGWEKLRLDAIERTAALTVARMRLDPAGIARGYAADQMMQQLRLHGCERARVDAGNVMLLGAARPGTDGWRVTLHGISGRDAAAPTRLAEAAVAFWPGPKRDGMLPLIDPASGRALPDRVPVVVIARGATIAESVAACAAVMGPAGTDTLPRIERGARVHFGRRVGARP